jgi:hypothetical protein
VNDNTGHGHVWARPDGIKARCGGPAICPECAKDLACYRQVAGLDHSDTFVTMFLGYLAAKRLCKPDIKPSELLDAWAEFKREMGK